MKIKLNKNGAIVNATVVFEKEEWKKAQDKAFNKLAKEVTVKGFRKGQAPLDMAKKHIDPAKAFDEASTGLVNEAFDKILEENKLDLILRPDYKVTKVSNEEFECEFEFVVRPEVTLGQYKDIEIEKEKVTVSAKEVNAKLEEYQQQYATVSVKEDGVIEEGSIVKFDFEGFVGGKAFDGGKANDFELTIGSHQFVPGFEEQMIGLKKGEKKDIVITFPEQYTPELAGKEATFKLNIKEVSTKNLPELNDDLALDVNIEGVSTLEELKKHIKDEIKHGKTHEAEDKAMNALFDKVAENAKVEIPEKVVLADLESQYQNFCQRITQQGLSVEQYFQMTGATEETLKAQMKPDVEKNLKSMFVLGKVSEVEGIKVTQEDIEKEYQAVADQYKMPLEEVKKILSQRENEIANNVYSKKITEFLKANNKIA